MYHINGNENGSCRFHESSDRQRANAQYPSSTWASVPIVGIYSITFNGAHRNAANISV